MSRSEEVDDSPMDSTCSDEDNLAQAENSPGTESENASSTGSPQHLPFRILLKPSCHLPDHSSAPSSPAQNINQLDVASSSKYAKSLKDIKKTLSTFLAPEQIRKAISHKKSDDGREEIQTDAFRAAANRNADFSTPPQCSPVQIRKGISHKKSGDGWEEIKKTDVFRAAANRNADFSTPPPCTPVLDIRSLSKNLTGTSTPSPDKRRVETDLESVAIKRFRKTPESNSDKPETLTESSGKSPTYLQTQQSIQKNEESKLLNTPSIPIERKKKILSSCDSNTENNQCSSESISPLSIVNFLESSTHLQVHQREVNKSDSGVETLTSIRHCSADSKSLANPSNPDVLLETVSSVPLPFASVDASSANPSTKEEEQKDSHLPKIDFGVATFPPKEGVIHPTTSTGPSNSHLPSSCLLKRSDSHPSNVSHAFVEEKLNRNDQREREFGSSTGSTPDRETKLQFCVKKIREEKEFSCARSRGMHRRSLPKETLRNRNSPEVEPSSTSQGFLLRVKTDESLPPRGLGMDQRFGSSGMFGNPPEDEALHSFLRNLLDLKYAAISIPAIPIDSARRVDNVLRLTSQIEPPSFNEPATARNSPDVHIRRNLNDSLFDAKIRRLYFPSTLHYSRPSVARNGNNLQYIDVVEGQASTSRYQPTVTEAPPNLVFDPSSNYASPPDGLQSVENPGRRREGSESSTSSTSSTPSSPLPDKHTENSMNALTLLRSVLKEMMLYNGEMDPWVTCEPLFRRFFESDSRLNRMRLHSTLMLYLANRGYGLWTENLFTTHEATSEALMLISHEKLILTVITTIGSILTRSLIEFSKAYSGFKELHSFFTQYWRDNRVEDIQGENSRKHTEFLKEIIERFLLVTRMAMQLMLIHIGKNHDEEYLQTLNGVLLEEDRMYLKRRV